MLVGGTFFSTVLILTYIVPKQDEIHVHLSVWRNGANDLPEVIYKYAIFRLDYFVISERIMDKVKECNTMSSVKGSDHCPLSLIIEL